MLKFSLFFKKIIVLTKKPAIIRWIMRLVLLSLIILAVYLSHLNNVVKNEFSKDINTDALAFNQQPKVVINMLLIVEDQSFFNHPGVDFKEIARVVRDYALYDKPLRGASTITQQLIKNTLLTRHRNITRKFKEALMSLLLEHSFDKEFILNRYLNTVYLAQDGNKEIRGFADAAEFYFNKQLNMLSLEEVATLVALVKGPSFYHPIKHPQRLDKRRQLVLSLYNKYEKIVK